MSTFTSIMKKTFIALILIGIAFVLVTYYSYIFSRTVVGRIDNVARVTGVTAMLGNRPLSDSQLHMFSVSIRQPDGELVTAISEDGQWASARAGVCVKAKYYPHPPWDLKNAGTFFNARLLTMVDCDSAAAREIGIDPASFQNVPVPPQPPANFDNALQPPPSHEMPAPHTMPVPAMPNAPPAESAPTN